jgi:8-hydroxy-5-deazaflavin:NADPH oxidoreductase
MKIGIIGAHIVGLRLASEFGRVGHDILVTNSRGKESTAEKLEAAGTEANVRAGSMEEVLASDLVVLAAPWIKREEVLDPAHDWNGRILVDATNIYRRYPPHYELDDLKGDSGSEIIARLAPTARVVKAFNTLDFGIMFSPVPDGMRRVLFMAGDDPHAVDVVYGLIADIGFHPVALGSLATAGRMMELEQPLSLLELLTPVDGKKRA